MPQAGFLFSIAGLSVTPVGFSGLVAALRRDVPQSTLRPYRLRQIPEMALISALVALIALPPADSTSDSAVAIRAASATALVLTVGHVVMLLRRVQPSKLELSRTDWAAASIVDAVIILFALVAVVLATAGSFEWLLVVVIARPAVAFVMALTDPIEA